MAMGGYVGYDFDHLEDVRLCFRSFSIRAVLLVENLK